jgi:hypothetical protein
MHGSERAVIKESFHGITMSSVVGDIDIYLPILFTYQLPTVFVSTHIVRETHTPGQWYLG